MDVPETQLRLVYSLIKPAVRAAATFGLPIKSLVDLLRLAYFEELRARGLTNSEIASVFGQTERHMRSLAARLESDFFQAEREIGLPREVEAFVAAHDPEGADLEREFHNVEPGLLQTTIDALVEEGRIAWQHDRLVTASKYVTFKTEGFHRRIDAINHFLDGGFRAVMHRVVHDDARIATLKTIAFSAVQDELRDVWATLEGNLRRDLAHLDENASFSGHAEERYIIAFALAPLFDDPGDE